MSIKIVNFSPRIPNKNEDNKNQLSCGVVELIRFPTSALVLMLHYDWNVFHLFSAPRSYPALKGFLHTFGIPFIFLKPICAVFSSSFEDF